MFDRMQCDGGNNMTRLGRMLAFVAKAFLFGVDDDLMFMCALETRARD